MSEVKPETGWVKLFTQRGVQVTLPVTQEPLNYGMMLANVQAMLDAGFLATAPGLDEGEEKEQVGWVLRGAYEKEGESTPFVLLYSVNDALTWSFLKVYLNRREDVEAFEYASKMKLDAIPEYVGNDKPQRGAGQKTDRYIVAAPKPFGVVFKRNPKHDPNTEEGKMKPARLFVRWEESRPKEKAEANEALRQKQLPILKKAAEQGRDTFETTWKILAPAAKEALGADREGLEVLAWCVELRTAAQKSEADMALVWKRIPRELMQACHEEKEALKAMLAKGK